LAKMIAAVASLTYEFGVGVGVEGLGLRVQG